ncbi:hypothetical protein [Myroides fluvii]|uniref:hypothetical protein n=1 Tax=Myroides fluvii TaxID=2572594 RepID=UPI00131CE518|nr:hypothetical protein [Myroides fluvii]
MKIRKLVKSMGLILFLGLTITACSSSDDNKDDDPDKIGFFNPKGDWKLTLEYENKTRVYTFSTNEEGISTDAYGPFTKTTVSHSNKALKMNADWKWEYNGEDTMDIDLRSKFTILYFDADNPEANTFKTKVHYNYVNGNSSTCYITLERTSKSDNPNPNPNPKKSIEGIWEHSNSKYQLKIEASKAIIYNLDHAPVYFPKKLVGDTFYDRITKTGEKTWSADAYQWRFTDDDYENGRWVNEGNVTLELSTDGNQLYQGTRMFKRIK